MLDFLPADITVSLFCLILLVGFIAGMIKGIVGFAMPMIFVTGLTFFVEPDLALSMLILPTLVTNGWQAIRQGVRAAWMSIIRHWKFLAVAYLLLITTTQLVPYLSVAAFYLILGVLVVGFAIVLLVGWMPTARQAGPLHFVLSVIAGFAGGVSGIWGPPTVAYLTTLDLDRDSFMRSQGVIYGLGAVLLMVGHLQSGLVTLERVGVSAVALPAALLGIWVGFKLQDRIDQKTFRLAILVTLALAGLNLIRRGLLG